MKFQKTALSTMLLTVAVAMSGNVQAGDQFMAAKGQSQTFTSETKLPDGDSRTDYKLIGGWDHSDYGSEDSLDHAGINTDITLTSGSYDEIVGGNHVRNTKSSQTSPVMSIGNTKVTISGGSLEYAVGGSKASTSGGTDLINGRVEMVVSGDANISKKLVGGNYVKNSSAQGAGATPDKGGESVVGDIDLTLQGGTFEGMVIGGSFAENYTEKSGEGFAMKLTTQTGKINTTVTGGTYNGDVVGGSAASGKNSAVQNESSSLIISLTGDGTLAFKKDTRIVGGNFVSGESTSSLTTGNAGVVIDGNGNLDVASNIVGGDLIEQHSLGNVGASSKIQGTSSVTISAANFSTSEEIIGGSYVHAAGGTTERPAAAQVGSTRVEISAGTIGGNVIGGGKVNVSELEGHANETYAISHVGTANVLISGGTINGAVIGGGNAKARAGLDGGADVDAVNIEITGGEINGGVIGGGMAYNYDASNGSTLTAKTGSSSIEISNAVVSGFQYDSGIDNTVKFANTAIIAGGIAYDKKTASDNTDLVDAETQTTSIRVLNSTVKGNVYGGGYAHGNNAAANTNTAQMSFVDTEIQGDVSTGGLVENDSAVANVKTAALSMRDTIVTGNLVLGGDNAGADRVTSAEFTGVNTAKELTGKADSYTFNATEENGTEAILDVSGTIDAAGSMVDVNTNSAHTVITGENATMSVDKDTKLTVHSTFADTAYSFDEGDSLGQLIYTTKGLTVGDEVLSGTMTTNENAKVLSETLLGSVAFVNQGAEFIADEGMDAIVSAAKDGRFTAFGAMQGGRSSYETGSHVSVWGVSLAAGTAGKVGNMTMAGFIEAGWGRSDPSVSGASGDGDHDYYGVGGAVRYDFESPFYLDGSLRIGSSSTEFDGEFSGTKAEYDADSLYVTAHVGGGYVFDLSSTLAMDLYGRYMFTYLEGDEVGLHTGSGEKLDMDDTTAHTVRLGFSLLGNCTPEVAWHAGLAYEHVFDGDAESTLLVGGSRASLDTPTLEGNSGIVDVGFRYQPGGASDPWTFGVNLKGYVGDRQGVTGSFNALYTF